LEVLEDFVELTELVVTDAVELETFELDELLDGPTDELVEIFVEEEEIELVVGFVLVELVLGVTEELEMLELVEAFEEELETLELVDAFVDELEVDATELLELVDAFVDELVVEIVGETELLEVVDT
jgi:hypothetical protein